MTIAIVQSAAIGNASGFPDTLVATFATPPTPGNEIIAISSLNLDAIPTWPSGYTEISYVDHVTGFPVTSGIRAAVKTVEAGEGSTVTVTRTGGDRSTLVVFEVPPGSFNAAVAIVDGNGPPVPMPEVTTTEAETLLIAAHSYQNAFFTDTPDPDWTLEEEVFGISGANSLLTATFSRVVGPGTYSGDTFTHIGETTPGALLQAPVVTFLFVPDEPVTPPPPDPGPVVEVSDPDDVFIGELTDLFDVTLRVEHNGPGYGSFKINRYSPDATAEILKPGNIVRVTIPQIDPNPIFAFFLEKAQLVLVDEEEEGGENVEYGGRGVLAYWDRAIWINESFLVDWVPAFIRTAHGAPPAGTLGAVHYAAGDYRRFTVSAGAITSRIDFSTGGFSSYYDRRIRVDDGFGNKVTLIHLTTGGVSGWWVRPYGAGVTDYPKKSMYRYGPSIAMSQISANQTPGEVLYVMYREATDADRPVHPLPLMTIDFDDTTDSDGDPWTVFEGVTGLSADIHEDFLSTVGKIVNLGVTDVDMGPDMLMRAFNHYGRDLTGDVLFAKGTNIADELQREYSDAPVGTWAEVLGSEDGVIARVELADAATRPPREIGVQGESADVDALESLGLAELEARLLHSDAVGFNVATPIIGNEDPEVGMYLPGPPGSAHGNYWKGDDVTLHTGEAENDFDGATVRIYAITIQFNEANDMAVSVEVNSGFGGFQSNGGSSGSSTSTTGGGASGTSLNADLFQLREERDHPNGYPSLDDDGLVAPSELPPHGTLSNLDVDDHPQYAQVHLDASADPTTGDDDADGWREGARWINLASGEEFVLVDASTGAAVWVSTTATGAGSVPSGTAVGDILVWDGGDWVVLAAGADTEVLTADSGEALGLKYAAGGAGGGVSWDLVLDEDGTSFANWTGLSGTWSSDGTIIKQTTVSASFKTAKFNTMVPIGFGTIYEAEIFFPTAGQGAGGFIHGGLTIGTIGVLLNVTNAGVHHQNYGVTDLRTITATLNLDTWYTLRIVAFGNVVSTYLNGVLIGSQQLATGAASDFLQLGSYNSLPHFRNIRAWVLSGGAPA